MQVALEVGRHSISNRYQFAHRTRHCRNQPRRRINLHKLDPFRTLEVLATQIRSQRNRFVHEINPRRQGRFSARKTKLLVIVKTDPHRANQIRRVTDKPAIA